MALLNNIWIHVIDEKVGRNIKSTDHPCEKGKLPCESAS